MYLILITFEAVQLFFSEKLEHSKSRIFSQVLSLLEMPSLNRNERFACAEFGREYTRTDASRHRKHCGVSNCLLYIYSSKELTYYIKKKHYFSQQNVKYGKDAQQSQNTPRESKTKILLIKKIGEIL